MWFFSDTECQVDKKVTFTWNSLFQAFRGNEFQFLMKDDISIELSKEIYRNIIKCWLHWAYIKTLVLPFPNVIEQITRKVNHENKAILRFENKSVVSYKALVLYHFEEDHIKVTLEWLKQKNEFADFLTIMKGSWSEGQFRAKYASVEWNTSKFKKSIQMIVIFLLRVFGRKDGASFLDKWILIIYYIIRSGSTLNWVKLFHPIQVSS